MEAVHGPELLPAEDDVTAQELRVVVARVEARGGQVQRRRAGGVGVGHGLLAAYRVDVVEGVVVVVGALQQQRGGVEQRPPVEVIPAAGEAGSVAAHNALPTRQHTKRRVVLTSLLVDEQRSIESTASPGRLLEYEDVEGDALRAAPDAVGRGHQHVVELLRAVAIGHHHRELVRPGRRPVHCCHDNGLLDYPLPLLLPMLLLLRNALRQTQVAAHEVVAAARAAARVAAALRGQGHEQEREEREDAETRQQPSAAVRARPAAMSERRHAMAEAALTCIGRTRPTAVVLVPGRPCVQMVDRIGRSVLHRWQLELQKGPTRLLQVATVSAPAAVWCACENGSEEAV